MGFPKQECWAGLLFPSPGDLPDPGIELISPILAGLFFTTEPPGKLFSLLALLLQRFGFCRSILETMEYDINSITITLSTYLAAYCLLPPAPAKVYM